MIVPISLSPKPTERVPRKKQKVVKDISLAKPKSTKKSRPNSEKRTKAVKSEEKKDSAESTARKRPSSIPLMNVSKQEINNSANNQFQVENKRESEKGTVRCFGF